MRYRIMTVIYHDGKKNYIPQRLTLTGYKGMGHTAYTELTKAEEYIRKIKAKKHETKYIW